MRTYKKFTLIGSSHIAQQSVDEVREAIEGGKPDIVALELDSKRAYGLLHKPKKADRKYMIKRLGLKGYLFAVIGEFAQKKLGEIVNIEPGSEMLSAIKLARENNCRIALVDQDIEITLRKLSKKITFREKLRFVKDIIIGLVWKKDAEVFDLTKVPSEELIQKLMKQVKERYPNVYQVLVHERNIIMSRNLLHIISLEKDKRILAVVGAGHAEDIFSLVRKGMDKIYIDSESPGAQ